ncbi:MAG TPA: opioid growth factor receptor-related protein [Microcoleaceae cyanobacterium]|jgi:hypothetical protein
MSQANQFTRSIVPFYLGTQRDAQGRTIAEIWAWSFDKLEHIHNYIQWLFPLPEKSAFNTNAPVVDQEVIQAFQNDVVLRQNLQRSFTVMLGFYGLEQQENDRGKVVITPSETYPVRQREWIGRFNHNYLRITRILKCLIIFGLEDDAQAFYDCLSQIYQENSDRIGSETLQYWTNAVNRIRPA